MYKLCVIDDDVVLGEDVFISNFVNLYGCTIGDRTKVGSFVEIQRGVKIGADCCIGTGSFLCTGVVIEDGVFIGPGTFFTNDRTPKVFNFTNSRRQLEDLGALSNYKTIVKSGASIGANSTILPKIVIGAGALIGAGSVVTKDVPNGAVCCGNPAQLSQLPSTK